MTSCGLPNPNFPVKAKVLKLLKHYFPILSSISNENTSQKLSISLRKANSYLSLS